MTPSLRAKLARPEPVGERLVDAMELAGLLGTCEKTVYNYVRERRIPCVPLGKRHLRFRYSEVVRALEAWGAQSPPNLTALRRGK